MSEVVPAPQEHQTPIGRAIQIDKQVLSPNISVLEKSTIPTKPSPFTQMKNENVTSSPNLSVEASSQTPIPVFNATFTKDVSDSLTRCGVQVEYVNPVALGQGANHIVYSYQLPNEAPQVIKIAKEVSGTTLTHGGANGESEGIDLAQKVFKHYAANTEVLVDPKNKDKYYVIQDAINGKTISNLHFKNNYSVQSI